MKMQNGTGYFSFWATRICLVVSGLGIAVSVEAGEVGLFFPTRFQEDARTEATGSVQEPDEQEGPQQEAAQEDGRDESIVQSFQRVLQRNVRNELKQLLAEGDIDGDQVDSILANLKTAIDAKSEEMGAKGSLRFAAHLDPKMRELLDSQLAELNVPEAKIIAMNDRATMRIAFEVNMSRTTASIFLNQNLALTDEQSRALENRIRSIADWQNLLLKSPIYYGKFGVDCDDVINVVVNEEFKTQVLRADQLASFGKLLTRLESLDRFTNQGGEDEAEWKEDVGDWVSEVVKMKIVELDARYSLSDSQSKKLEIAGKSLSKKFIELKGNAAKEGNFASRYAIACPPGAFVHSSRFWRGVVAKTLKGEQSTSYVESMKESDAVLRRNMCNQLVFSFFQSDLSVDVEKQQELSRFVDQRVKDESFENGALGFVRAIAELPLDEVEKIIGEEAMQRIKPSLEGIGQSLNDEFEDAGMAGR